MYEFHDLTPATKGEVKGRMAESFSFNGVWIEDEIPQFVVTGTTGRELMEAELDTFEVGFSNGSKYRKKRYPERKITVHYMMGAQTDHDFRQAYNKLNALLDPEQAQLIFADEPDKYFVATKTENSTVEPGKNFVVGEIVFTCTDPLKYSTVTKSFPATLIEGVLTANIENKGTAAVPIDYKIHMNHENGYIGIVSESGAMQYGKKEEADGKIVEMNERLLTMTNFFNKADDGASGVDYMHPNYDATGTLAVVNWWDQQWLSFGSAGPNPGQAMTGGQRTVAVPADSKGHVGAKNFYSYFFVVMWAGLMGQVGEFNINRLTADNKQIAGVNWYKQDLSGNTAHYELWSNGKILKSYDYESSHETNKNPWWRTNGHCDLRKVGRKLTFYWWATYPSFEIPEIENWECAKISMAFKCHPVYRNRLVTHMGIRSFIFDKLGVQHWKDVPNRYPGNADMIVKGNEGKMYFRGMPRPQDEMTGTKYFLAKPGVNKVEFYHSSFSSPAPTITAEIREAWL
ncbi:distal tail protein Dit [Dubosiella newyorkensis]|uniref:distal tail protein Dit n=1 Tax=Dubosiella newyorkensis TaxID=1862672 RepID=UPI0023EFA839|nr:distal tail protein Dit [Dubosiella newyorkensis]